MPGPLARTVTLALLSTFALAWSAEAADRRFYLNAKWGSTDVDGDLDDTLEQVLDGDEDSFAFELGWRFIPFLGVQLGYHDFGDVPGFGRPCLPGDDVCIDLVVPTTADTTAYSLTVVPRLPLLGSLALFGKVGFARWESEVRSVLEGEQSLGDFSDEELIYGVGLRLDLIGPVSAFAEYEKLGDLIETISLGASLSF